MITKEELAGTWNEIKGHVKQEWGNISDDDLKQVEGNIDRLVGIIQKKTGQARTEIEKTLRSFTQESASMLGTVSQTMQDAAKTVQNYAGQASEMTHQRLGQAQELVRMRPAESLAVSFGTGLLLGIVVGLVVRSK